MKAKAKERKRQKVAEQAWREEQAWLEAERVAREQAEAKRVVREAEEQRARKEEEKCRAKEEKEAERKCKAEAKAGASGSEASKVKKVIMDPSCMCCAQAQVVCKFLMDGNKKRVACVCCNQSKGKCRWPRDGKDAKASPMAATKADKGKKQKADEESPDGSRERKAGAGGFSGLEDKLKWLIDVVGLITNNLAGLFEAHETMAENSGRIADMLKAMLNESYSFGMAVLPSDLGSSELDSDKLCKEAEWLKAHGKDEEEESEEEDESMAE
ncbi:hypothetical protein BKA82DRAFT_18704 [Pisolithus tinctorius]|uniref:Uncharacterized protein n=1 Tax=Pisolithus tinctorius Marx 270 TaxID=870435 RepID=A0A0C3PWC0_PISTI|nr:hypothetical protein BKA82DRAFT_18704 [Pisolithus tinctorius]KIO13209.1 hypothetical protein M404DRAFT_18704 [Pisolithus tinctorius Marx 270]